MGQKSQQDALYLRFFTKKLLLSCHFCQKNVHSLKNTLFSRVYLVRKTSIFSKTLCSPVNFFKIFMKNPLLPCLYLVKKTSILSKLYYIFGQKVNRMPFFLIFQVKTTAFMPIFCQKTSGLSKTQCSNFHILSKSVHSLKNIVLNVILSKFFMKNPFAVMPIVGQKNKNSVKTTLSFL